MSKYSIVEYSIIKEGDIILKPGIYEQVISKNLGQELDNYQDLLKIISSPIDPEEASKILSKYIEEVISQGLENIKDNGGKLQKQIDLANRIVSTIVKETGEVDLELFIVDKRAEQLVALMYKENSIYALNEKAEIVRPVTSIAQSSLFTGAKHEPSMISELKKEISSADRIDFLVSFIKWSGIRMMIEDLRAFSQRGGKLRIITTSYMGATDAKAIEELNLLLNTEIKISYNTKNTRLHAKSYVFYRNTGYTTAYVGSSNLSNAAISSGLEWNVKVTAKDLPDTINKIEATFESYWNSSEFEFYDINMKNKLIRALKAEQYKGDNNKTEFLFDITPYPFQQEILDKLDAERKIRGYMKNLVVAATGTGKTVISAFDYKRYCNENPGKLIRLLFVAHRKEILMQSIECFQGVLKDRNFGDLLVDNLEPEQIDHLFISIQSFNSREFHTKTTPDFYDFIIIDEFHHAAAPSYERLLNHYNPKVLLGLTATPERMDSKNIVEYFDNRIAAEIRLPEAIDRNLLSPFQYFGVTDTVNLDTLKWTRGGYDKTELSNIYSFDLSVAEKRANMIIESIIKYVTNIDEVKALGFCISVDHANFMADYFNKKGIPSAALTGVTQGDIRSNAKDRLVKGDIRFIFVVDIYNEGVDIPEVNTVLFLRPTESLTIFLQQLGRGLRLAEGKECLTVLDFIGQSNNKYNFEDKFAALLSNASKSVQSEIKNGFISVPKGCYIQLERKAKDYILNNIKSYFNQRAGFISKISTFEEDSDKNLTLRNFIEYYHLDIRSIYKWDNFSRLCVNAGVLDSFDEPLELLMTKAFPRICAIDSRRWIRFLLNIFSEVERTNIGDLTKVELRMLQMFQFTIWQKSIEECGFETLLDGLKEIKRCPILYEELLDLLQYNFDRIDFIDEEVDLGFDSPLDLYCNYTRDQLLVAMDYMKPSSFQMGAKYLPYKKVDVLLVTLNKSDKYYSPTTMYKDYSINESLFHWQSQSATAVESVPGQRYINHKKEGSKVALFVREYNKDIAGAAPYTFLGLVDYLSHEGSRPISIIWRLHKPIPSKYLKKTNKLVVG